MVFFSQLFYICDSLFYSYKTRYLSFRFEDFMYFSRIFAWLLRCKEVVLTKCLPLCENSNKCIRMIRLFPFHVFKRNSAIPKPIFSRRTLYGISFLLQPPSFKALHQIFLPYNLLAIVRIYIIVVWCFLCL